MVVDGPQLGGSSCGCDSELRKSSLSQPVPLNGELCSEVVVEGVLVLERIICRLGPAAAKKASIPGCAAANSNTRSEA